MALPKLARNTLHSSLAGASAAIGNFLGVVLVARILGPGGAGNVALAIWIVGTAVTLCDLGLPLTVARFMPELAARGQEAEARAFASAFFLPLLATTLALVLVCAFLYLFHDSLIALVKALPFDNETNAIWAALGALFALQAVGNYGLAQLRGAQRFDLAARLSTLSLFVQLAGVAVGASLFGVPGALVGYGGGSALLAVYALARIRPRGTIPADLRRRAWSFAAASWGVGLIAAIVWSRTEIAFLNHWRGPAEAGLYSVANTLALVATQAPLLMTGGLLAHFSEQWAVGDRALLQQSLASALRFMAFLIFPACFGMAAVAPAIVPLMFGERFAEAVPATTVLVAAQAVAALSTVTSALLFAVERNRFLVRIGAVGAVVLIACGFLVVPAYGLMGAVGARVVIQLALVAAAFVYIARGLEFALPLRPVGLIALAALGCALVARAIVMWAPGLPGLIGAIVAGAIVYIALARLLRALPREDLSRLGAIFRNLPPWLSPVVAPLVLFLEH